MAALGREDLADLQYATGGEGARVKAEMGRIFASRTREEWVSFLRERDVCFSPVLTLGEALAHPNATARGMVVEVESSHGGTERQPGLPLKFFAPDGEGEGGWRTGRPGRPPFLGEHDEEILTGLGYREEQIAELRSSGVIRPGPEGEKGSGA